MRIFAYIRVSTEMQTRDNQEYEIRRYCRNRGLAVSEWVSESVSGTIAVEKRQLGAMLERMERGDLLICTELSRLGRNMLMIMGLLNICASKGISIHTIKDNFDLSDTINSKIIAFAFALAAEIERNLISQRTKEALAVRRMKGVRLGRPPGSSAKKVSFHNQIGKLQSLIDGGMSYSKVAEIFGIHRNTLRKYLKELGESQKNEKYYCLKNGEKNGK